jgi:hypothetical protein
MKTKALKLLLITALLTSLPARADGPLIRLTGVDGLTAMSAANGLGTLPGGLAAASITSVTGSVSASSTQVTLTAASTHVLVSIGGTTPAITYLSFVTPATTSNFAINPTTALPGSVLYQGGPVTSIWLIGASAAGTYSVLAW